MFKSYIYEIFKLMKGEVIEFYRQFMVFKGEKKMEIVLKVVTSDSSSTLSIVLSIGSF